MGNDGKEKPDDDDDKFDLEDDIDFAKLEEENQAVARRPLVIEWISRRNDRKSGLKMAKTYNDDDSETHSLDDDQFWDDSDDDDVGEEEDVVIRKSAKICNDKTVDNSSSDDSGAKSNTTTDSSTNKGTKTKSVRKKS